MAAATCGGAAAAAEHEAVLEAETVAVQAGAAVEGAGGAVLALRLEVEQVSAKADQTSVVRPRERAGCRRREARDSHPSRATYE